MLSRVVKFRSLIVGLLVTLVLISAAAAVAGVPLVTPVTKTTSLSGNCTGTQFLSDINSTATFTGPCSGTAVVTSMSTMTNSSTTTINSTSTTTTATTTNSTTTTNGKIEMVAQVFGQSCGTPVLIDTGITQFSFQTPFKAIDNLGRDAFSIVFAVSDTIHNKTYVTTWTSLNGRHNLTASLYSGAQTIYSVEHTFGPQTRDALPGESINFYQNGVSELVDWYTPTPNGAQILTAGGGPGLGLGFTPTSDSLFFAPLAPATSVNFTDPTGAALPNGTRITNEMFVGESVGAAQVTPLNYVVTPGASTSCATPLALALSHVSGTNICETQQRSYPTTITEQMIIDN